MHSWKHCKIFRNFRNFKNTQISRLFLRVCNLLKRNFIAEIFMKHFPTFSTHLSRIVCQRKWYNFWERCRMQTFLLLLKSFYYRHFTTVIPTHALPAILKILRKTHKKYLWWRQFSVHSWMVDWKSQIT